MDQVVGILGCGLIEMKHGAGIDDQDAVAIRLEAQVQAVGLLGVRRRLVMVHTRPGEV